MILLSARKVWLWVQRDGGTWGFLKWTRHHFVLHRHLEVSLEVVKVETLLILQESQRDHLLEVVDAVPRWMFSSPDLLQGFWFVHLRLENLILLFLWEISPLSHWVFSSRFPMRPSFPPPQGLRPVCHPSKFTPRTKRIRGTIQVRLSFQIDGFGTDLSQL